MLDEPPATAPQDARSMLDETANSHGAWAGGEHEDGGQSAEDGDRETDAWGLAWTPPRPQRAATPARDKAHGGASRSASGGPKVANRARWVEPQPAEVQAEPRIPLSADHHIQSDSRRNAPASSAPTRSFPMADRWRDAALPDAQAHVSQYAPARTAQAPTQTEAVDALDAATQANLDTTLSLPARMPRRRARTAKKAPAKPRAPRARPMKFNEIPFVVGKVSPPAHACVSHACVPRACVPHARQFSATSHNIGTNVQLVGGLNHQLTCQVLAMLKEHHIQTCSRDLLSSSRSGVCSDWFDTLGTVLCPPRLCRISSA